MRLNVLMSTAINMDAAAPPLLSSGIEMARVMSGAGWRVKLAVDGGFEAA